MQTLQPANIPLERLPPATRVAMTAEEKWQAVIARDPEFEGSFVFAVRSTGVYCRPSCPSRRARRENVEFFSGPDTAEQAGFRACQRCRPREPSPNSKLVARVCGYLEANVDEKITLANLGELVGLSPFHLQKVFRHTLGVSPRQYVERLRLDRLKRSLRDGETVNDALYDAGFSSRSRLYDKIPGQLGVNPGTLRRGGQGLQIHYTIMDSPLGRLLLGATDAGICAVCMGASDSEVEERLVEDYPDASLGRNDEGMNRWVSFFKKYFEGQSFPSDLPIDVRATAFQWKVWKKIQSIPYGQTISYAGLAKALGNPRGARAVANACANNRVALVVPCHRVVGKGGDLRGYKWGLERKQSLLSHEGRHPASKSKDRKPL
jgi:AraC family transcriptional regulator, regulatory protein of adaptative response / methylated-DNA-[protein]-cysteine methyltransferase